MALRQLNIGERAHIGCCAPDLIPACEVGQWGPFCNNTCRCKVANETCNHVNGSCDISGCVDRFVGIGCDTGKLNYICFKMMRS